MINHREGHVQLVGGNIFVRHTTDSTIGHSGGNERQLLGTDRNSVQTCKVFVRNVVVLFLAFYRVLKSMEPLSFDSSAETDVVRRSPTSAKVFVSASAGTRTRDLPHGNRTL